MSRSEICLILALLLSAGGYAITFANRNVGSQTDKGRVFTLYRNSIIDKKSRTHVGTFDANDSAIYNQTMCEKTKRLMLTEPGTGEKYWCEPGYFHEAPQ